MNSHKHEHESEKEIRPPYKDGWSKKLTPEDDVDWDLRSTESEVVKHARADQQPDKKRFFGRKVQ